MQSFEYKIKDELGIHARPAGILVKLAQKYKSEITVECNGKKADAKRLFNVMGLNVRAGNTVKVNVSGEDEAEAKSALDEFFGENL